MKKFLIILVGVAIVTFSFTTDTEKLDGPVQRFLTYDYELGGPCNGHGGSEQSFLVSWNVATCKTNCEKKIGFRCGKVKVYQCRDGSFDVEVIPSSCPSSRKRNMEAEVVFFDMKKAKIT